MVLLLLPPLFLFQRFSASDGGLLTMFTLLTPQSPFQQGFMKELY